VEELKISLITVTYNSESTIKRCIESVIRQNYNNLEYIVIDGKSNDNTIKIIDNYKNNISCLISEPDNGIYEAMNKGIALASGHIVGTINSDDFFADDEILNSVAQAFIQQNADILYGNLNYINPAGKVIRKWNSGEYKNGMFNWGWMPPHPSFYCKKQLFDQFGLYDLKYGTAADYELMVRFMHSNKVGGYYLNKIMVNMITGGISNKTYINRLKAWSFDLKAMLNNNILFPFVTIFLKPLRKIIQYI
jgi:glycosyltransferase involved in cell wall biosynthesis